MHSSRIASRFIGGAALAVVACSAPSEADPNAEASENAQTSCEQGIALPDIAVEGYVVGTPVPPAKSVGVVIGPLDEREPTTFDPTQNVSYAETNGVGRLERRGWTFEAKRGERFVVDAFAPYPVGGFVVLGPIGGCKATETDAPAAFEGVNGWRAPRDGTYFVTTGNRVSRNANGVNHAEPTPQASQVPTFLAMRRLLADDTPAGHAFVETKPIALLGVTAMRVGPLPGESKPAVLLLGTAPPKTNGGAAEPPSLVVIRRGEAPRTVAACAEGLGSIVVGDFDGDHVADVLSGTNLFRGDATGGFACGPSALRAYDKVLGPVDIDGDGKLDVVTLQAHLGSPTSSSFYVTPHFQRAGGFVQGAYRSITVPFGTTSFDGPRSALLDVNGDGKPEVAVVLGGAIAGLPLPALAPEDATPPSPNGSPVVLVVPPVVVTRALVPEEIDVGTARVFDADGDGIVDRIEARPTYSYAGLSIAYGKPGGGVRRAWDIPASQNMGDRTMLDHMDWDGDGCEDVIAAGYGFRVFRGLRCTKK